MSWLSVSIIKIGKL